MLTADDPNVLDGRQAFTDAQAAFAFVGVSVPLGFFTVSWYGTAVSDERGSFGIVDPELGLADGVGEIVEVDYHGKTVRVYIIGSQDSLATDLAITRRSYLAVAPLAVEPITATIGVVS
jgi:hypothetical protein